jgi:hypothetical protein
MKYREMRQRAFEHLVERLREEKVKEARSKQEVAYALKRGISAAGVEHLRGQHRACVSMVSKLLVACDALRKSSRYDNGPVEDFVRPIWRPFHHGRDWWMPVHTSSDRWFMLRTESRTPLEKDKRVYKVFNRAGMKRVVQNLSGDTKLFSPFRPAKGAIQSFPELANGFLWDAISSPDQYLEKICLGDLYDELLGIDRSASHIWIDGPGGTRYIYGIGRNFSGDETTTIHVCAGSSKRKRTLCYMLPGDGTAVYYQARRPRRVNDENFVLFRRFGQERLALMWWGEKKTPKAILDGPEKFHRTALFHLHGMDQHNVPLDISRWQQEDELGGQYRIVPL